MFSDLSQFSVSSGTTTPLFNGLSSQSELDTHFPMPSYPSNSPTMMSHTGGRELSLMVPTPTKPLETNVLSNTLHRNAQGSHPQHLSQTNLDTVDFLVPADAMKQLLGAGSRDNYVNSNTSYYSIHKMGNTLLLDSLSDSIGGSFSGDGSAAGGGTSGVFGRPTRPGSLHSGGFGEFGSAPGALGPHMPQIGVCGGAGGPSVANREMDLLQLLLNSEPEDQQFVPERPLPQPQPQRQRLLESPGTSPGLDPDPDTGAGAGAGAGTGTGSTAAHPELVPVGSTTFGATGTAGAGSGAGWGEQWR